MKVDKWLAKFQAEHGVDEPTAVAAFIEGLKVGAWNVNAGRVTVNN